MALKLDEIMDSLIQAGIDVKDRKKIIEELQKVEQEKKEEREANKAPKTKKEFVVLIRGDDDIKDKVQQAWVVQRTTGADNSNIVDQIKKVGRESNAAQKRNKNIVTLFREVFAHVKRKFWVPEDIMVKTKDPCQVVVINSESISDES